MSERRGLLSRVRNRLSQLGVGAKAPTVGIGPGFPASYEEDWNELVEQVDNYTQKIGAAVVQTWEVGAAELARSIVGMPDEKVTIERYSDALVPTLTPFQDLHKKCSSAFAQGLAAGIEADRMAAATAPQLAMVDGLGEKAREGWEKTATYMRPVFELCADPDAAEVRFRATGDELAAACDAAHEVLRRELAGIPERPRLWDGVCDSWDNWQLALVRGIEISVTNAARALVADVRANRR